MATKKTPPPAPSARELLRRLDRLGKPSATKVHGKVEVDHGQTGRKLHKS